MTATRDAPPPIDARMPRFNQGAVALGLLAGFVFRQPWVIPAFAIVLGLGAAFGPRWGPFLRIYADVVRPRVGPPPVLEDPRPPRFAALLGTVFLGVGSLLLLAGASLVAWGLALLVAGLAALAAVTGVCVGCEVYVWLRRRSTAGWDG